MKWFVSGFTRLFVAVVIFNFVNANVAQSFAQSAPTKAPPKKPDVSETDVDEDSAGDFDLEANLKSFDQVWSTIDSIHWDEDKVGQAWDDAKEKYRPKVESAKSVDEVRQVIGDLIGELGQSHFGIIPASSYEVVGDEKRGGEGNAGLDFRATEDGIVVSKVREDSPAARAGIKPGWTAESIGDKSVADLSEKIRSAAHGPMRFETLVGLALPEIAAGKVGETKKFVFRDGEGETREMELELEPTPGKTAKFGNLPAMKVTSKTKTFEGQVGYYQFSAFLDPVRIMTEYREAVHDENHSGGIIIDLRGNIGGLGGMTMGMASELAHEESTLGFMTSKGGKLKFFVNASVDPVNCPVAVLIDECSISSAEIFSGGLQDLKLARLFGSRTAGLALPSVIVKLPNGDGFQYAIANYHSVSGKTLEMDGVTPDVEIPLTGDLLRVDEDPVLTRALEWIRQQQENDQ